MQLGEGWQELYLVTLRKRARAGRSFVFSQGMKRISSLFEKRSIFNSRRFGVEESWAMKSTDMEARDEPTGNSLAGQRV